MKNIFKIVDWLFLCETESSSFPLAKADWKGKQVKYTSVLKKMYLINRYLKEVMLFKVKNKKQKERVER